MQHDTSTIYYLGTHASFSIIEQMDNNRTCGAN